MTWLRDKNREVSASIGRYLKTVRKQAGIPQQEMAKSLKVNASMVAKIERGERTCSIAELILFADFLRIDPSDVIYKVANNEPLQQAPQEVVIDGRTYYLKETK